MPMHCGEERIEGLSCAGDRLPAPLAVGPKRTAGIIGVTPGGRDKTQLGYTQGGRVS